MVGRSARVVAQAFLPLVPLLSTTSLPLPGEQWMQPRAVDAAEINDGALRDELCKKKQVKTKAAFANGACASLCLRRSRLLRSVS